MCYEKNWVTRNSTPTDHAWLLKVFEDIIRSDLRLPNITVNDVDKCHRIGPTDNDGKQNIIIKFTKHVTATKVFRERRKLRKLISCNNLLNSILHSQDSDRTSSLLPVTYAPRLKRSILYFRT